MSLKRGIIALATIAVACARFTEDTTPVDGGSASSSSSTSSSSSSSSGMVTGGAEILAAGLSAPTKVRATKKVVYWIGVAPNPGGGTTQALHFCPVEGCGGNPPTVFAFDISDFTISEGFVYWTSGARLQRCPIDTACPGTSLVDGIGAERAIHVAVANDVAHVSFTDAVGGRVVRCAVEGCGLVPTQTEGMVRSGPMAANSQGLFFFAGATVASELHRFTTKVENLGTMPGLPTSIAVVGSDVYFVSQQTLFFCQPTTTCAPISVSGAFSNGVYSVSARNDDLFWTLSGVGGTPGKILRCTNRPCRDPKVVFEGGDPAGVDVEEGWIYWSDLGGGVMSKGTIKRLRS